MKVSERKEVQLYGDTRYANGYKDGYKKNTIDRRKRLSFKENYLQIQFGHFYDFLSDKIYSNKKK